ncbi:MAG: xanthine dehydrogenase family protein subunit M [Acidobacteria bacterium]|nr:MAG: xanthine dehydrogenase family protein subunit M [Acidobacteriota bacterium]
MFPARFDYHRATTVDDALRLLGEHPGAKLLAGGHSLIPMMKLRLAMPEVLIDVGRVSELKGIEREEGKIYVGALTTHAELAASEVLAAHCPILAEAASKIADPAVRNKGTIGGNVAHADPASDLPAVLVATGAVIHLKGRRQRQVKAADFFTGLLATDLGEDEILTRIEIPDLHGRSGHAGSAYLKYEHPASGYAICGAAAVVKKNADGTCAAASLALNGVSATPFDAARVCRELIGAPLDDAVIRQAVNDHLHVGDPLSDVYASGLYRAELAKVYGRRALRLARDRAR